MISPKIMANQIAPAHGPGPPGPLICPFNGCKQNIARKIWSNKNALLQHFEGEAEANPRGGADDGQQPAPPAAPLLPLPPPQVAAPVDQQAPDAEAPNNHRPALIPTLPTALSDEQLTDLATRAGRLGFH